MRRNGPQSPASRDAVRLMQGGATFWQAAIAVGVAVQTAEVWYLRWIVYPEWKAMKEQQGATPMQSLAKVGAA